jgi:chemotaxis protein CheD
VKHVVGIADIRVSAGTDDSLITYGLGSCLGITIHDPIARVGGLLHIMLPDSSIDPVKARINPCMFADTGFPKLVDDCIAAGASQERMVLKAAGGSCARGNEEDDYYKIGSRNFLMLQKLLGEKGLLLAAYDVGGSHSRTMSLDILSGEVLLKVNGCTKSM